MKAASGGNKISSWMLRLNVLVAFFVALHLCVTLNHRKYFRVAFGCSIWLHLFRGLSCVLLCSDEQNKGQFLTRDKVRRKSSQTATWQACRSGWHSFGDYIESIPSYGHSIGIGVWSADQPKSAMTTFGQFGYSQKFHQFLIKFVGLPKTFLSQL